MYRVLLVEDKKLTVKFLVSMLKERGFEPIATFDGAEALKYFESQPVDVVLSDIHMEPMDGIELLRRIRATKPEVPVILVTGYQSMESALAALKLGAFDYIPKPYSIHDLLGTLHRALAYRQALEGCVDLGLVVGTYYRCADLVAASPPMREVCEIIWRVGPTSTPVLISGEDGAGKSRVARAIHSVSTVRDKPFVRVDCREMKESAESALNTPLMELTGGGTLYLDHVDRMPLREQAELVKRHQGPTESGAPADASAAPVAPVVLPRLLASTTVDPAAAMESGTLSPELYALFSGTCIPVRPLRERHEDVLPLLHHVLQQELGAEAKMPWVDLEVFVILERYSWPGNARELVDMVHAIFRDARPERIHAGVLPEHIRASVAGLPSFRSEDLKKEFLQGEALRRFLSREGQKYLEPLRTAGTTVWKAAAPRAAADPKPGNPAPKS